MITAFAQTVTTFTSQNFAAKKQDCVNQILKRGLIYSVIFSSMITIPITVFRYNFASFFSSDPLVIEAACVRIIIILTLEPICSIYEVICGSLRGMGYSGLPAILTIVGTCIVRIVWIFTVFKINHQLSCLFVVFPISWVITIILVLITYEKKGL